MSELASAEKLIPPTVAMLLLLGLANAAGEVPPQAAVAVGPDINPTALVGEAEKTQRGYFKELTDDFVTFATIQHPQGRPIVAATESGKQNIRDIIAETGGGLVNLGLGRVTVERVIKYLTVAVVQSPDLLNQSLPERLEIQAINLPATRHEFLHQFLELASPVLNVNAIKEGIDFRTEARLLAGNKSEFVQNSPFFAASCQVGVDLDASSYLDAAQAVDRIELRLQEKGKIKTGISLDIIIYEAYSNFANKIPEKSRWGDPMPDLFMFNYVGTKMGVSANEVQKAFLTEPLFACK